MATTTSSGKTVTFQTDIISSKSARVWLALSRIGIGLYFLWAFLDKTFGLGYSTPTERAWINGGSPTSGFLGGVIERDAGPLTWLFEMFNNSFGDVLFMLSLAGIGIALVAGAGLKIAAVSGALLLLLMYLANPPFAMDAASNPIMDAHVLEGFLVVIPAVTLAGDTIGLGRWWGRIVGNSWLR